MKKMKQLIIFFLISSLISLSSISLSLASSEGGGDEAADPMDPTAPNSAPFAMPDADGDDNVLTPATLLKIPEADAGASDVELSPGLSPTSDPFAPAPSPGPGFNNPNVIKTCQATDNPVLCAESLRPFVDKQPDKAGDSFSLLEMQIMATQEATQRALSASINPKNRDVDTLKHCKDVYVEALSNLKEALEAVPTKDFGKIKAKLSAAMTNLDSCDEGFEEINKASPMEKSGGKLNKMVSNCLSMVASINGDKGEAPVEGPMAQGPQAKGPAAGPEVEGPEAEADG